MFARLVGCVGTLGLLAGLLPVEARAGALNFVEAEKDGIGTVPALNGVSAVAMDPLSCTLSGCTGGLHLYAASAADNAVAVFARDPATRTLHLVEVQRDGIGGVDGLLGAASVAVTPGAGHVYVAGELEGAIAVFSRNAATGALTFVEVVRDGVNGVDGLAGVRSVAVSPDGAHVYAVAYIDQEIAVFSRNATTGQLTFVEADTGPLTQASGVSVSGDGAHVYTAATTGGIGVYSRNATTGAVTLSSSLAGSGPASIRVSPVTGSHVYVASTLGTLKAYSRAPVTGALTLIDTETDGVGGVDGLAGARSVDFNPTASHVYVAGADDDAVAVFSRDASTGLLTFVEFEQDGVGGVDGLNFARGVAVSPDGLGVYAAGQGDDAVAAFTRNTTTGALSFVEAERAAVDGLNQAFAVAVSPSSSHVYVAAAIDDAVSVFSRNVSSGALTFLQEQEDGAGGVDGLDGARALALSPNGAHLYVAGSIDNSVAIFSRNATTGGLAFLGLRQDGVGGVDGLAGASALTVSPDGAHVYGVGSADNAVAAFSRNATTGLLTFVEVEKDGVGGVDGLAGASSVAVAPDGAHVYVAGPGDDAVAVFSRDASTGALSFLGLVRDGVAGVDGLAGAISVASSGDGGNVYVAGPVENALAVFRRSATTGALTFVEVERDGVGGVDGLAEALSVVVSPVGSHVYVAGLLDDAVAVFSRNPTTGALSFVEVDRDGVAGVDGLNGAVAVTVSPDGKHLFAAGSVDDAVAAFSILRADLNVFKTHSQPTAVPGESLTFTITVTSSGPDATVGAVVSDPFPSMTGVAWTCSASAGSSCGAPSGVGPLSDTVSLLASGNVTYSATGTVDPGATGFLANTVTVAVPAVTTDPNPANNSSTDSVLLAPQGDLSITKTDGQTTAVPGLPLTYTITAANAGPSHLGFVQVFDIFPGTLTSVSWTCSATGGSSCGAPSGMGLISQLVDVHVGGTVTFAASGLVSPSATGTLSNTATVTHSSDTTPGNNSATDTDTLAPEADLSITKTDGQTTAIPGGPLSYDIVVANDGPSVVNSMTVTDAVPPALLGPSFLPNAGSYDPVTGSWTGLNVLPGQAVTLWLSATVDPAATGMLTNTATVAAPAGTPDPNPANDSASDTDTLTPHADLSVVKDDGLTTVVPGLPIAYTITVSNAGPSTLTAVTLTDPVPPELLGAAFTPGTGSYDSGTGAWTGLSLPQGATATLTLAATVDPAATIQVANTAFVAAPAGATDPNAGNDNWTDIDSLTPEADLGLSLSDAPDPVLPGATVTFTAAVGNAGPSASSGMTLVVNLPPQVTYVSSPPSCVSGSGAVSCTLPGLAPGGTHVVPVEVTVNTGTLGLITTTASVTGNDADPVSGNDADSETTSVTGLKGDFDSDGKTDILWRHAISGKNVVWYMDGITRTAGVFTNPDVLPDTNWQMVGTSDFNSDLKSDILWRHAISGKNVVWYMDGITRTAGVFTNPDVLADTNWRMVGTGDFSSPADAKPDVLWRHAISGKNVVWYMDGITRTAGVFTNPDQLPDTNWQMVGVGDFSSPQDGATDVVFRHALSGKNVVWSMDGITRTAGVFTNPDVLPDTNWRIAAIGDYNSDSRPDFLFRHQVSGKNVVWYMDGITRTAGVFTNPDVLPDTNWRIVGPK